ncbi:N-acetylmuramoyl-L-alanine amidase [Hominibacterium faecale]|uniref:peptidoglycan recognition protein family protein n=2 Tax=Bacteria TaxID=2 RepID=UPI0022B2A6E2|nr:N-acetylmuramoyl-L-alanine amidase [Hominibacterium faecale]
MASKPKIKKKISKRNRTLYKNRSIKYLVLHYVGAVSKAADNAKYFYGAYRGASAHYFVDDSSIYQVVEDKNAAWHCGGGLQGSGGHSFYKKCTNANSIGIELCCKRKNGKLYITDKTLANAAKLVQYLQAKYDIPDSRVIRHYDVTGKNCPAPYINADKWKAAKKVLIGSSAAAPAKKTAKLKAPTRTIYRGCKGGNVKRLQRILNKYVDAGLNIDGSFGPATEAALRKFQRKYGLAVDGSCGPKTRAKIKKLI